MMPIIEEHLAEDRFIVAADLLRRNVQSDDEPEGVLQLSISSIYGILEKEEPDLTTLREMLAD